MMAMMMPRRLDFCPNRFGLVAPLVLVGHDRESPESALMRAF